MLCPTCRQTVDLVKIRSNQQNRAYFGLVVAMIAEDRGYSKEAFHKALAGEFLGYDEIILNGTTRMVPKSTKELTTVEFKAYEEAVRLWAIDEGYYIPEPKKDNQ